MLIPLYSSTPVVSGRFAYSYMNLHIELNYRMWMLQYLINFNFNNSDLISRMWSTFIIPLLHDGVDDFTHVEHINYSTIA